MSNNINESLVRLGNWAMNFKHIELVKVFKCQARTMLLDWLGSDASNDQEERNRVIVLFNELEVLFTLLENTTPEDDKEIQKLINEFGLI